MQLNDNGLPLPGRELDAAVWGLLGYEVTQLGCAGDECGGWFVFPTSSVKQPCYQRECGLWAAVPEISTTRAFFQVMEAIPNCRLDGRIEWQYDRLFVKLTTWGPSIGVPWLKTIEETLAHAVCVWMWKAMGDAR